MYSIRLICNCLCHARAIIIVFPSSHTFQELLQKQYEKGVRWASDGGRRITVDGNVKDRWCLAQLQVQFSFQGGGGLAKEVPDLRS